MKKLQNSIVDSNRNVNHLNNLIGQASQDLQLDNKSNTESSGLPGLPHTEKIAVLVFSCNRPDAIRSHLDQLISKRKATVDQNKFPIIVSQDCGDTQTAETIENYKNYLYAFMKVIFTIYKSIFSTLISTVSFLLNSNRIYPIFSLIKIKG